MKKQDEKDKKFNSFLNFNNLTFDYCNMAGGSGLGAMLIRTVAQGLVEHGNIFQRCPIRGHLYIKDYAVDLSNFPFAIPVGIYSLHIFAYTRNKTADIYLASCTSCAGFNEQ